MLCREVVAEVGKKIEKNNLIADSRSAFESLIKKVSSFSFIDRDREELAIMRVIIRVKRGKRNLEALIKIQDGE